MLKMHPKIKLTIIVSLCLRLDSKRKDEKSIERIKENPKACSITIIKNLKMGHLQ
jgi:hypothetical protein